jgi:hypothetical protein
MTRYDLISPREGKDGKTRWLKIGAAFPRDKGGFSLVLDALPLPDKDGRVSLLMTEPLPKDDDAPRGNTRPQIGGDRARQAPARDDIDDQIPF